MRLRRLRRLLRGRRHDDTGLPEGSKAAFSVHGEDLIARELLWRAGLRVDEGFYVDVGAYHPWHASNTAMLYRQGWSGIVVEPNPDMARMLRAERPRDIVVEAAIADRTGSAILYVFGPAASSNTLDAEWAQSVVETQHVEIERQLEVPTLRLSELLDKHLPSGQTVDLLSVDVEGLDHEVLLSNDWDRHRPSLVAVEEYQMDLSDPGSSETFRLMSAVGYRLVSRAVLTNFYLKG